MPEEKITKILEQKWFLPGVLVALIVVVNLVLYVNLCGAIKVLNTRIENLEKTVTQLSKTFGLLPAEVPTVTPEITPGGPLPAATPTEETSPSPETTIR